MRIPIRHKQRKLFLVFFIAKLNQMSVTSLTACKELLSTRQDYTTMVSDVHFQQICKGYSEQIAIKFLWRRITHCLACSRLSDHCTIRRQGWRVSERRAKIWAHDLEKGGFLPFYFRIRTFSQTRPSWSLEQANHCLKWTLTRANVPETATWLKSSFQINNLISQSCNDTIFTMTLCFVWS